MRNLLNFLLKYNNLIVFLFLEGIALYWLASGNSYHNSSMVKGMQGVTKGLEERISNARSYLSLREINANLAAENSALRNSIERLASQGKSQFVFLLRFHFQTAISIHNCQGNK